MPDRRWNLADLELVARGHALTDKEVAERFGNRRTAEIRRLRDVLHAYHVTRRSVVTVVPNDNIAKRLAALAGRLACARCQEPY